MSTVKNNLLAEAKPVDLPDYIYKVVLGLKNKPNKTIESKTNYGVYLPSGMNQKDVKSLIDVKGFELLRTSNEGDLLFLFKK